ncbi:MAG TPA: ABC transporter permease [Gemmatimonadales bacterium]|nr:ABC transporter permease [Gemmatimonadales bacterium]
MNLTRIATGLTALTEGVGIAVDSLRANKTRAALTILGIAIGVMVVMAMAATVKGINSTVDRILAETGPTTFWVSRTEWTEDQVEDDDEDPSWWRYPPLQPEEAQAIRQLPSVDAVSMEDNSTRQVFAGGEDATAQVYGRGSDWVHVNGGDIVSGRSFTYLEDAAGDKVAVLNERAAEILFGRQDPVGRYVKINNQNFTVIGVYHSPPNLWSSGSGPEIYTPYTTFRRHVAMWTNWSLITVRPKPGVPQRLAIDEVTTLMRQRRGLRPAEANNFGIVTQDRILENWNQSTEIFFMVMIALSGVGLMVGGIGVIAIMMISVTERTREIGVRKALGATRTEILWQFLVEASTLTVIGGAVGMVMGGGLTWLVKTLSPLPASVPPWSIAVALLASALTGIVFGMIPANRAARLDPVEALRYE